MSIQETTNMACRKILSAALDSLSNEEQWLTYLNTGDAERAIAGDHHGRHWLELVQNARDAIFQARARLDEDDLPRVLLGVTEKGIIVANTGIPFALHEETTRRAVQYLQRSTKAGAGFVGHKGIGLKSILLRAGGFEVRTHVDGEPLRVQFSRLKTAVAIISALRRSSGCPAPLSHQLAAIVSEFGGEPHSGPCIELGLDAWRVLAELPRLSLFQHPHPLQESPEDTEARLLEDLLADEAPYRNAPEGLGPDGTPSDLGEFATVVYLPFRDMQWDLLLDRIGGMLPPEHKRSFEAARRKQELGRVTQPEDRAWTELTELDPRVFVLLGEMPEIQLVRYQQGQLVAATRYDITRPLQGGASSREVREISISKWHWKKEGIPERSQSARLFVFSAPTELGREPGDAGPAEQIRVLFEGPPDGDEEWTPPGKSQPLSLYYPITNANAGLPFTIHGPFHVTSSRTDLADDGQHNLKVLEEAVEVVKKGMQWLASKDSPVRNAMPWMVAPVSSTSAPDDRLLSGFATDVYALLRDLPLTPTGERSQTGSEALFDPANPGAYDILGVNISDAHLLAPGSRVLFERWWERASETAEAAANNVGLGHLLNNPGRYGETLVQAWRALLQLDTGTAVEVRAESGTHVEVQGRQATAYFRSVMKALNRLREKDKEEGTDHAVQLALTLGQAGIPLIPARRETEGSDGGVCLVRLEDRSGGIAKSKHPRVVFWRDESEGTRRVHIRPPPSLIPVYVADVNGVTGATENLGRYWREWGTSKFEGLPDLFRRVVDRLADRTAIHLDVLGYLAGLLFDIRTNREAEDLRAVPYAAWDLSVLNSAHKYWHAKARLEDRFRDRQRYGVVALPTSDGESAIARNLHFGTGWADVLSETVRQHEEGEAVEQRWAKAIRASCRFRSLAGNADPELPQPDAPCWEDIVQRLRAPSENSTAALRKLMDLFMALGVNVGPRLEFRWLDPNDRGAFERMSSMVGRGTVRAWSAGKQSDVPGPPQLLLDPYLSSLKRSDWHPAFTAGHSDGCSEEWRRKRNFPAVVACWTWDPALKHLAKGMSEKAKGAYVEAVKAVWPELSSGPVRAGWLCDRPNYHKPYGWRKWIPSLYRFQLVQSAVWPAMISEERQVAAAMIRWSEKETGSGRAAESFLPGFVVEDEHDAAMARDLGVVHLDELRPAAALERLTSLLQAYIEPGPNAGGSFATLAAPPERPAWVGAANRLTERLMARLGTEGADSDEWRLNDLGYREGWLRGRAGPRDTAFKVVPSDRGLAKLELSGVVVFPERPNRRDVDQISDRGMLESPSRSRREFANLAKLMGAEVGKKAPPLYFPDEQAASPELLTQLADAAWSRAGLLLGYMQLRQRERLDEDADQLQKLLNGMVGIAAPGPEGAWSGLTQRGTLAFSMQGVAQGSDGSVEPHVLAEGLAVAMGLPAAVTEFEYALSAPFERVKGVLKRRGVDVAALLQDVPVLNDQWMQLRDQRLEQVELLLSRWAQELTRLQPGIEIDTNMVMTEDVRSAAARAGRQERLRLLRLLVHRIREVMGEVGVNVLFSCGVATEICPVGSVEDLGEAARQALRAVGRVLVVSELAGLLTEGGALDSETVCRIVRTATEAVGRLRPYDDGDELTGKLASAPLSWRPASGRLLEWDASTRESLGTAARSAESGVLSGMDEAVAELVSRVLESGTAADIASKMEELASSRSRALLSLERRLDAGQLDFGELASEPASNVLNMTAQEQSVSGTGGGGGFRGGLADVHLERSRIAELAVIEHCWRRFLKLDLNERGELLDSVLARRESGLNGATWGLKSGHTKAVTAIAEARDELVAGTSGTISATAKGAFRTLIDISVERGPGFDVLDPFGSRDDSLPPYDPARMRRVEVKAVMPGTGDESRRIVLTTNEFHKARADGATYVLRLLEVPENPEDLASVRWIGDFTNPVVTLGLRDKFVGAVRGGHATFYIG